MARMQKGRVHRMLRSAVWTPTFQFMDLCQNWHACASMSARIHLILHNSKQSFVGALPKQNHRKPS